MTDRRVTLPDRLEPPTLWGGRASGRGVAGSGPISEQHRLEGTQVWVFVYGWLESVLAGGAAPPEDLTASLPQIIWPE